MENYRLQTKYLLFYNGDETMKKSIETKLHRVVSTIVPGLIIAFQVSGQTGTNDKVTPVMLPGSHILCAPYRDLNPFSNFPGELNEWGTGTVYLHTGDSAVGRFLIYNSLGSNLLTVKYGTETIFLVEKSTVKSFTFRSEKRKNEVLTYEFFPMKGWYYSDGDGAFLKVLVKDTVSLYHMTTIEKFPMSDNLKEHHYYFIQESAGDLKKVMPNRKDFCKTLDCPDEFRKHLRGIHLRNGKRDRIIRIVREYNLYKTRK